MFKFLNNLFEALGRPGKDTKNMTARIVTTEAGAALYVGGTPVATYSRARDAKRGALRRGLTLA